MGQTPLPLYSTNFLTRVSTAPAGARTTPPPWSTRFSSPTGHPAFLGGRCPRLLGWAGHTETTASPPPAPARPQGSQRGCSPGPAPSQTARPWTASELSPSLVPFLDLLAELITTAGWGQVQGTNEVSGGRHLTSRSPAHAAGGLGSPSRWPGNPGSIPTVPANSHSHSRPSPTKPRAARPTQAKEVH